MIFWASVEWGATVARIYKQQHHLPDAVSSMLHVVLPDLPDKILPPEVRTKFFARVPMPRRLQTIAACNHPSKRSLLSYVENSLEADHVLVVGGNDKTGSIGLTSTEAIRILTAHRSCTDERFKVWAVANPNCKDSVDDVRAKYEAGATGIITQPLLSSHATETLHRYATVTDVNSCTYVAGLALPTSVSGLMFWGRLVAPGQQQSLEGDPLFEEHCAYLARESISFSTTSIYSSTTWAANQAQMLSEISMLSGIHYMPLHNTPDLIAILLGQQR